MQLPKSIMQMRLHSSNSILYSPSNQQLRLRLDLKMGEVKQSNCNQGLGLGRAPCAETVCVWAFALCSINYGIG